MNSDLTLLVTSPGARLTGDLARQRPDWRLVALSDGPPREPVQGTLWGFVDWLGETMSGLEMCRRLREAPLTRAAHITMVLDEPDSEARRRAMQAGADDYLTGPLDAARLIERVEGPRRTGSPSRPNRLANGAITLDAAAHQVRVDGALVTMRPNEFRLLAHFIQNRDQVFSRASLIAQLGKEDGAIDDRTVDVWVGRLRRALVAAGAADPLRTVRSLGYVMDSVES